MKKTPHGAVFVVWREDSINTHSRAVQLSCIPRSRHLPCNKTLTTTISPIFIYGVICKLVRCCHPQMELHAHLVVIPINDYVRLRSCRTQTGASHSYAHYHRARNQQERFNSSCICWKQLCCASMLLWCDRELMWVWQLFHITQQPVRVAGSYTYGRVMHNTEKHFMCSPWT